jgi:hypothetical protein
MQEASPQIVGIGNRPQEQVHGYFRDVRRQSRSNVVSSFGSDISTLLVAI